MIISSTSWEVKDSVTGFVNSTRATSPVIVGRLVGNIVVGIAEGERDGTTVGAAEINVISEETS